LIDFSVEAIFERVFAVSAFILPDDLFAQLKEPEFAVDYAQYKFPDNLILLEIYYSLFEQSLTNKNITDGYQIEATIVTF